MRISKAIMILLWSLSTSNGQDLTVLVEKNVAVAMRDGTILRADVYKPDKNGLYPVLVHRTPYGKSAPHLMRLINQFVKAGYIVVSQDVRGRYASAGVWESFWRFETHDAHDGFDTVVWASKLDQSNGKVGTFGISYDAFLQWRLAPLRPAPLLAMSAHSIPARMIDLRGAGTIRPGRRLKWFITEMAPEMRRRSGRPGITDKQEMNRRWEEGESEKWLNFLPWLKLPREVFEDETDAVHFWLRNPHKDPWKLHEDVKDILVPNLNIVGWFDHCNGDLLLDRTMRANAATDAARRGSHTIIGPWSHFGLGTNWGKVKFGRDATIDTVGLQVKWFDHWLNGEDNGVDQWAPFRIFVMGDNRWRNELQWPLARAKEKVLYLSSSGHANTPNGDGRLLETRPAESGSDNYTYDPEHPVPTLYDKWAGKTRFYTTVSDQFPLRNREDILVYQSDPLAERVEVTGNPIVELYAATSASDTDFIVRLIDVAPDGLARDVSMGMIRTRYRMGLDKPTLVARGEVVKYTIRMNPTANAFLPGHRIRLDITSSDFPNFDRNHNTATDQNADPTLKTATQTLHHGGLQATRVLLPWIELPVKLVAPVPSAYFEADESILLKAKVNDSNVRGVEFLADGTVLAVKKVAPFEYRWKEASRGRHEVEVRVVGTPEEDAAYEAKTVFVGVRGIERVTASSSDDVEEQEDGMVYIDSSDLELMRDGERGLQVVGLRFNEIAVPQGVQITNAHIQFTSANAGKASTNLRINAELSSDAAPFKNEKHDVTSRRKSFAFVNWSPPAWTKSGEQSEWQQTPNLSKLVEEVVSQPDWKSGNSLALLITGKGYRNAVSFDGNSTEAPRLYIEYEP